MSLTRQQVSRFLLTDCLRVKEQRYMEKVQLRFAPSAHLCSIVMFIRV